MLHLIYNCRAPAIPDTYIEEWYSHLLKSDFERGTFYVATSTLDAINRVKCGVAEGQIDSECVLIDHPGGTARINKYGAIPNYPPEMESASLEIAQRTLRAAITRRRSETK